MHLRMPSIDRGVQSFIWAVVFFLFLYFGWSRSQVLEGHGAHPLARRGVPDLPARPHARRGRPARPRVAGLAAPARLAALAAQAREELAA